MTTTYGLTLKGFSTKPQSEIITEIQKSIQGVFGNNTNFAPSSNMGQLVGIFSEREALLWQLAEAVYASQYPGGAEGTSVDNILALNNMRRNAATPTRTNPTSVQQVNGITLYGLLLKGSAGAFIEAKSIIQTTAIPPLQFKTDSDATIQIAINAVQGIYFNNIPTSGAYVLIMPNGINSASIPFNATASAIQAIINNVFDGTFYPYTDATVSISSQGFAVTFGNGILLAGQPTCGKKPIALMSIFSNTLQSGVNITNIKIINSTQGANAQAVVNATCISDGPNFVAAGSLSVIGTPISGWASVVNELDCLLGSNVEEDTEALIRRSENLQANASGPLLAIIEKVKAITNVITAIGNENVHLAAIQKIIFIGSSISGTFKLSLNGVLTISINYNATASQVQTIIRAVSGYENVLVKGDIALGFIIDFNGSFGGKELPLIMIEQNTTTFTMNVEFGLPGKSFEIIVQGGDDVSIANAILSAKPGGMLAYGSTVIITIDTLGNSYAIGFSRPSVISIYVTINLITDLTTSLNPLFNVGNISTIQTDIVNIGNNVSIGGLIIGFGTNGLIGAFNSVPGIVSYTLNFGRTPNPTTNSNIQMQSDESPLFESFLTSISYL
jgi:uncharacterized phage protein gp47/JayE